jgi:Short C-terminal domain
MSEAGTTAQATAPKRRRPGRALGVWILLVLASLLLLLSTFAIWVDRVALNTDVFVDTSSQLIEDEAIRTAVATRAVDELFANVNVESELQAQLPDDYKSLSGPAAAGLREAAYTLVARALAQPRLESLWSASLRESHETLVAVLEGDGERVSTEGGVVSLDLERIVLEAADRIGIRDRVEGRLPEDVGRIEILRSDELDTAQDAFQILNTLAWVLPVLALLLFAAAAWLAPDRRRLVRRVGIALAIVGLLGLLLVNLVGNYLVNELVADTESRTAASNAWDILTDLLRGSYRGLVVAAILFLVAAWLAGPGRRAVASREFLAPAVRERLWPYVGLALVGLFLLLIGPVGDFTRFLAVAVLVALGALWIEVTRSQTRSEFPDASGSVALADARTRLSAWWDGARERATQPRTSAPAASGGDLTSQLASLAELHRSGELTDDEYASAKARVLAQG